ncbi:unnamed protein product [Calypogeia fissa]
MEAVAGNFVASSTTALRALHTATTVGVSPTIKCHSPPALCSSFSLCRRGSSSYGGIIVGKSRSFSSVSSRPWGSLMVQIPEHAQFTRGSRGMVVAAAQEAAQTTEGTEEAEAEEIIDEPTTSNGASTKPSLAKMVEEFKAAIAANDEKLIVNLETQIVGVEVERDALAKQVATLVDEANTAKERLLRLNADFDNFRKRTLTEKANLTTSVRSDVIETLLPMVDNFERAKASIKVETEGEEKIDKSYQSIYKQFVEIMKGLGVVAVETVGKPFDPNLHEAIMRDESSEYPEDIVVQEFRRGFCIGDKLLRPAMVKVSAGPGPANVDGAGVAVGGQEVADDGSLGGETEKAA